MNHKQYLRLNESSKFVFCTSSLWGIVSKYTEKELLQKNNMPGDRAYFSSYIGLFWCSCEKRKRNISNTTKLNEAWRCNRPEGDGQKSWKECWWTIDYRTQPTAVEESRAVLCRAQGYIFSSGRQTWRHERQPSFNCNCNRYHSLRKSWC